ncbi:MAG: hypothetical protein RL094_490 [Candidatus Parcubacteria bacterium]|jgi:glutamyl-tRNA synthetase
MNSDPKVVTRFAPSPTGYKHVGNYRTALFDYIYAKQHGGSFVLRIEDTDKARNKPEFEQNIYDTLNWLGLSYDKVYIQTKNIDTQRTYLKQLIEKGLAYVSPEEAKDGSGKINELIRFNNPNEKVSFTDLIRGTVEMDTTDLGDFIIAKNIDEPIFHFAVVVDDFDAGVTHILRGEDHISNTPRHVLIQRALGAPTPIYAHFPLVNAPDRTKLSSRKGAAHPTQYMEKGYLPIGLINYLCLLGWHPVGDNEVLTLEEIIAQFDLSKVQKASAIFDEVRLKWFNKEHCKRLSDAEYTEWVMKFLPTKYQEFVKNSDILTRLMPTLREKISYFGELAEMEETGDLEYFFMKPSYDTALLLCPEKLRKGKDVTIKDLDPIFTRTSELLSSIEASDWTAEKIKEILWPYADETGRGLVLWALRAALSGKEKSPDPFVLSYIVGKDETLARISKAQQLVHEA